MVQDFPNVIIVPLALYSSRRNPITASHNIELRPLYVTDQTRRVLHLMNVGARLPRSSFIGAIHHPDQFAKFDDNGRDYARMSNSPYARRSETIECAVEIPPLLHMPNLHDIDACSNRAGIALSPSDTL